VTELEELRLTRVGGLLVCLDCRKQWLATWPKDDVKPRCSRCGCTGQFLGRAEYDAWRKRRNDDGRADERPVPDPGGDLAA
jgi:hypothetical protein